MKSAKHWEKYIRDNCLIDDYNGKDEYCGEYLSSLDLQMAIEKIQADAEAKPVIPDGYILLPLKIKARSTKETDSYLGNLHYLCCPTDGEITWTAHYIDYNVRLNGEVIGCRSSQGIHKYTKDPMFPKSPCKLKTERKIKESVMKKVKAKLHSLGAIGRVSIAALENKGVI